MPCPSSPCLQTRYCHRRYLLLGFRSAKVRPRSLGSLPSHRQRCLDLAEVVFCAPTTGSVEESLRHLHRIMSTRATAVKCRRVWDFQIEKRRRIALSGLVAERLSSSVLRGYFGPDCFGQVHLDFLVRRLGYLHCFGFHLWEAFHQSCPLVHPWEAFHQKGLHRCFEFPHRRLSSHRRNPCHPS